MMIWVNGMQFVKTSTERNLDTLSSAKRTWGVEEQRMFEIAVTVGKIQNETRISTKVQENSSAQPFGDFIY